MDQTQKKQDDTICADCQGMNGVHKPDCMYAEPEIKTGSNQQCSECKAKGGHLSKCSKHDAWRASLAKQANAAPQTAQAAKVEHNWKLCYAKSKEKGVPQADVKKWYTEQFGVESGNDLTAEQFKQVIEWLESLV